MTCLSEEVGSRLFYRRHTSPRDCHQPFMFFSFARMAAYGSAAVTQPFVMAYYLLDVILRWHKRAATYCSSAEFQWRPIRVTGVVLKKIKQTAKKVVLKRTTKASKRPKLENAIWAAPGIPVSLNWPTNAYFRTQNSFLFFFCCFFFRPAGRTPNLFYLFISQFYFCLFYFF